MNSLDPLYLGAHPNGGHMIQMGDGSILQVPTKGLTTHLTLQALAKMPKFAEGGTVDTGFRDPVTGQFPPADPSGPVIPPAGPFGEMIASSVDAPQPAPDGVDPQVMASLKGVGTAAKAAGGGNSPTIATGPAQPMVMATPAQAPIGGGGGGGTPGLSDLNKGAKLSEAGIKAAGADKVAEAGERLPVMQQQLKDENDRLAAAQAQKATLQRSAMDMLSKSQAAADAYANATVDPAKKTSLLSGLALILGGAGAGFQGKDNPVVQQLAARQEQEIARQKYNIEHKKGVSEEYGKVYDNFRQAGMDVQSAFEATDNAIKKKDADTLLTLAAAHAGPQAAAALQSQMGGHFQDLAKQKADIFKNAADTHLANATAAHTGAETAQMGAQNVNTAAAQTGQKNLDNGVPWNAIPGEQRAALTANAQKNEMLIPDTGITRRKVTPEENTQLIGINSAKKITNTLDDLVTGKISGIGDRVKASALANGLTDVLPKALGSSARLGPNVQEALKNLNPSDPAAVTTFWKEHSDAIKSVLGASESSLHENLGTTFFKPKARFSGAHG
jgi:hypothetical protein